IRQRLQQQVPYPGLAPAAELPPDRIPIAELRRQVAPRRTGAADPEYPVQFAAVVLWWAPATRGGRGQKRREDRPLVIRYQAADHCRPPQREVGFESRRSASGESATAKRNNANLGVPIAILFGTR